jgi:glutathione synthase/RimK-type ligase-like ATP-grasp enzyme
MNIFYDSVADYWYQTSMTKQVTFGGNKIRLPFQKTLIGNSIPFHLNVENQHVGPIIGIITARKADGTISGNSSLFIKLQKKLLMEGGISYVFTLEDVHDEYITGYIFLPDKNQWKKVKAPYPDLVYNRIPFRRVEQEKPFQLFVSLLKMKRIPFFNPNFLNKFELHCLLQNHKTLKKHLPETIPVADSQTFAAFLKRHHCVYLKPSHSAKGKGIYRLTFNNPEFIMEGLKRVETYPTFLDFWEEWERIFIEKQYLVQEEIDSAKYDGKKFDLRILAHAGNDKYKVTGIGVRQAVEQDITTHIPNGGKLLPYNLFHTNELEQFIALAVNEVGATLSRNYGFFGEFSIDAGISSEGNYYLYEVNSKPMSFDEMEIEEKKMEQLCRLFFQLSHFPFANENSTNAAQ